MMGVSRRVCIESPSRPRRGPLEISESGGERWDIQKTAVNQRHSLAREESSPKVFLAVNMYELVIVGRHTKGPEENI